jgi:hypothetical protein
MGAAAVLLSACDSVRHEQTGHHFPLDGADQCGSPRSLAPRQGSIGRGFHCRQIAAMTGTILGGGFVCFHRRLAAIHFLGWRAWAAEAP